MEKITNVKDLTQETVVVERKISDFSNMDLSHLDLSKFDPEFWEGAIFYNTNLSNTGIRFIPRKLYRSTIEKCNFENVDLSYIEEHEWRYFSITDANLRNTGVKIDISRCDNGESIGSVLLDESYGNKPAEYWDDCIIDFSTLIANPFIHISSYKLFSLIQKSVKKYAFLMPSKITKIVKECEQLLKDFDDGTITRLYELVCKNFNYLDKLKFFQGTVESKVYKNISFNDFPIKLLKMIDFSNCTFEKLELNNKLEKLFGSYLNLFFDSRSNNSFQTIELSDLTLDSWKNLKSSYNKLGIISFKRFLYLELGMKCNCNCKFCRNKSFNGKCEKRDLNRILSNLELMQSYIDTIFIGGGEPTLYLDDIIKIRENFRNLIIVTNGAIDSNTLARIRETDISLYISRHDISDTVNCSILDAKRPSDVLSMQKIREIAKEKLIDFTPVCVKGGLDSSQKIIEYIAMSFEYGIKKILISTLHENASLGVKGIDYEDLYVSPNIFDDVFSMLLAQGFERKRTICSTGGYILKRFVKNHHAVSFKIYISKEQFPEYWKNCVKRTFDFTMTPSGDVYQDWCKDELINIEELKS